MGNERNYNNPASLDRLTITRSDIPGGYEVAGLVNGECVHYTLMYTDPKGGRVKCLSVRENGDVSEFRDDILVPDCIDPLTALNHIEETFSRSVREQVATFVKNTCDHRVSVRDLTKRNSNLSRAASA